MPKLEITAKGRHSDSLAGDSDIVARISADPRENLLESVVTKVQGMPGVLSTETLPAFSKY